LSFEIMAIQREVEPPTFGLGNRFAHQNFNDLRQNVANVLHPFPTGENLHLVGYKVRQHCLMTSCGKLAEREGLSSSDLKIAENPIE
jgi:hypothetical protein